MNDSDLKSLLALPIILVIAIILAVAGSYQGVVLMNDLPLFAVGVAIAFLIQWLAFIPAYLLRTEKFYDLTGSLTYMTIILVALALTPEKDLRSMILAALVLVWAFRLGSFLFIRVLKAGEDRRFEKIKQSAPQFFLTWTLQGLWISFTLAAALAAITADQKVEFGILGMVGLLVWIIGFGFEVIADHQKNKFRSDPTNKGKFIQSGLWSISRHPNYFGEIVLWVGVALIALPNLVEVSLLTLVSPVFVIFLLTKVSGVPLLEKRADEKWGGQEEYEEYKKKTPVLVPWRLF